ncbi:MAG TPA: dihydrofolate reductase family protein [Gaiellaceae bacterium]|jgi:dihydrofolate reductase|nr:dihydrofolate reductase family protein [Gaiellaceae bacterium]HEX2495239.1 dihydrofolate reductase family protein [Gaiellaceae bacterium]
MGRIIVTEFVSMDGVMEAPGGEEGYKHTAWTFEFPDEGQYEVKTKETDDAEVMLLGRVTYEGFAAAWPEREESDDQATADFAKRFNSMPKYVVSTTLEEATWQNTTILRSLDDVARLKDEIEGDILAHGSNTLVHGLLGRDLVDVLRLMIFPVILGIGKRIFPDDLDDKIVFDLTDHRQYGSIVVHDYTRQGR